MAKIRNIIFDLGGVLFDIDYSNIARSFRKLGISDFEAVYTQLKQDTLFDDLETGRIRDAEFRERIRTLSGKSLNDETIDAAWNSILIGFPKANIELLQSLRSKYRLFLLSNTNEIHEKAFREMLIRDYGNDFLEKLFDRVYLSHRIHLRKPDLAVFEKVLSDNALQAKETLFIDDSPQHIKAARTVGVHAYWLNHGEKVAALFDSDGSVAERALEANTLI